jgi:catechol 2,3-dioxygenase-like lactoylglutathione lyase family enzyme
MIESVNAVTLATHNMPRAVAFYRMLGFEIVHGGDDAAFTSFRAGTSFLNLVAQPRSENGPGGDVSSSTIPTWIPSMRA